MIMKRGHASSTADWEVSGLTGVGHLAEGDDLVQQDPEGPHVRLDGELSVVDGLRRRPLHGELGAFSGHVVILVLHLQEQHPSAL